MLRILLGQNSLEKPCMSHLPWLLQRGIEAGGLPCGHALMATCPPKPFSELTSDIPFGYRNARNSEFKTDQRTWEISKVDLNSLLELSSKLNLDSEVTPVMAWGMILAYPRIAELTTKDFESLTDELGSKVRCFGYVLQLFLWTKLDCTISIASNMTRFGAVMEEFEVRDAIVNVLSTKRDVFTIVDK